MHWRAEALVTGFKTGLEQPMTSRDNHLSTGWCVAYNPTDNRGSLGWYLSTLHILYHRNLIIRHSQLGGPVWNEF